MNKAELHTKASTFSHQVVLLRSYLEMVSSSPCLFIFLLKGLSGWNAGGWIS